MGFRFHSFALAFAVLGGIGCGNDHDACSDVLADASRADSIAPTDVTKSDGYSDIISSDVDVPGDATDASTADIAASDGSPSADVAALDASQSADAAATDASMGDASTIRNVTKLTGTVIGTPGSYNDSGSTRENVFDEDINNFFDGRNASSGNGLWAGLDINTAKQIVKVRFYPRPGYSSRMIGGKFQGSNTADFSSETVDLYTLTNGPSEVQWSEASVTASGSFRYVRYLSPNGGWGNVAEVEFYGFDTPPDLRSTVQLGGTVIGTPGSYNNSGSTRENAFDSNVATFFDGPNVSEGNGVWAGLDLGIAKQTVKIRCYPRDGQASRMIGGKFQGSNTADFSSGVVNLYVVPIMPVERQWSEVPITNPGRFRYVRYLSPDGSWGNVAEVEFYGPVSDPHNSVKVTGAIIGTLGSYGNYGTTREKVFDGDIDTFFDGPEASNGIGLWAGLDLISNTRQLSRIRYYPRQGATDRMLLGKFQGSNTADFSTGVVTLYTILDTPSDRQWSEVPIANPGTFRYVRYLSPAGGWGDVAEVEFYSSTADLPPKLTGTVIGTLGSYNEAGYVRENVFDGDIDTFFSGPNASNGNGLWTGLDLSATKKIMRIRYYPRTGEAARMNGGKFQGSNTADFSSGTVDLYTLTAEPPNSQWGDVLITASESFRYVRYLSPNGGWGDVAEVEFYGSGG